MTNRKSDRKKNVTRIVALAIAGIMAISVILAAVLH
jgi:hypothetical protein